MSSTIVPEQSRRSAPAVLAGGNAERRAALVPRLIGWQGLLVQVPDTWDLTGFSGDDQTGYVRIDDGEEMAVEVKWATEPVPRRKSEAAKTPSVEVRRDSYFRLLRKSAKKKKMDLAVKETDAPKSALRSERVATGFTWTADRKATGVVWYCETCRRTVIAQVLGSQGGRAGFGTTAEAVLGALRCHGDDPDWRTWALYDLQTEVPTSYRLESQELMNVYLRLTFARKTARLTVEQWALANVARKQTYLDIWIASNTKSPELNGARYTVVENELHTHPAIRLTGGLAFGLPMLYAGREALRFQWPATRFGGAAWECEPSNKLFAVSHLRPARQPALADAVAERTRCHSGTGDRK
ncbi:MAG: hypothetical protein H7Z41_19375 [Cytophagales bacterium]|nr:hypothetical protein [Armatimonadota bacterium]